MEKEEKTEEKRGNFEKELEKLKSAYSIFQKKYSLPSFERLAEDFDIDKLAYKRGSFILRDIRRTMNDRLNSYMSIFETFLNPSNSPSFVLNLLKHVSKEESKEIKEIYKVISKIQIKSIEVDVNYDEKKEAEYIKSIINEWHVLKQKIYAIAKELEGKMYKSEDEKERGYFG